MPYPFVTHRIVFDNEGTKNVELKIYKKDSGLVEIQQYEATDIFMNADSDEGTIISHELVISLWAAEDVSLTWQTFIATTYDDYKVEIFIGGDKAFDGFLVPEENQSPFLDKPYEVNLRATDGLKLLKNVPLKTLADIDFKGEFTLITYITACLRKTFQELPIRIYCSIYEKNMNDRTNGIHHDMYQQIKFDHRTFQKNAVDFEDCYTCLLKILKRHSRLFYYNGWWHIFYLPEHQYRPGGLFYTNYNSDGAASGGVLDSEGIARVGKNQIMYANDEAALVTSK